MFYNNKVVFLSRCSSVAISPVYNRIINLTSDKLPKLKSVEKSPVQILLQLSFSSEIQIHSAFLEEIWNETEERLGWR